MAAAVFGGLPLDLLLGASCGGGASARRLIPTTKNCAGVEKRVSCRFPGRFSWHVVGPEADLATPKVEGQGCLAAPATRNLKSSFR